MVKGRYICIHVLPGYLHDMYVKSHGHVLSVGTGKSSIVCAICLGLGGSPKLLGRAKDVSSTFFNVRPCFEDLTCACTFPAYQYHLGNSMYCLSGSCGRECSRTTVFYRLAVRAIVRKLCVPF